MTLHVFGDSFAEGYDKSWTSMLAKLQNVKMNNQARGGTSIEWSALNLHNTELNDGDIVLFVLSNVNRFDVEPYITVDPCGAYKTKDVDSLNDPNLEWYVKSRSDKLLDFKVPLYTGWIYSLSQQYPTVKFLLLSGFEDSTGPSHVADTKNYISLTNLALNKISHYEANELKLNPYMLYNICGQDPRINHLSSVNLENLAHCVNDVINSWDSSLFVLSRFTKNVINKHVSNYDEMYELYVKTGILDEGWIKRVRVPVTKIQGSRFHMFKQWLLERNII